MSTTCYGLSVQEPSTTKNSSSSRAPKTGAQLRDNPDEHEKWGKPLKSPSPPPNPPLQKVEHHSLLHNWTVHGLCRWTESEALPLYNRRCVITGTFTTVDELQRVIDHGYFVVAQNEHATTVQNQTSCNCGISTVSHDCARTCWTCTTDVDHLINVLQLENLYGNQTKGICICATTGMSTTWSVARGDTLKTATSWNVNDLPRPLLNSVQGVNLEDLHHASADPEELDCQRPPPPRTQTLLNPVLREGEKALRGENHKNVHWLCRHFHQLFCHLRRTNLHKALWNTVRKDLGHFDNLVRGPSVDLL